MAKETERYKQEAIALYIDGATFREISETLARKYERRIVHFTTVFYWVKTAKASRGALRQSDEKAA